MSRTWDNVEKLRCGVDEVEDLRDEEKHQSLAEVTHDAYHSEDHAGKVTVCVSYKHLGREPVVLEKCKRYSEERQQKVDREQVRVSCWVECGRRGNQIKCVVQEDQQCDDNRLSNFDSVDTSKDVDAVRTENGNG